MNRRHALAAFAALLCLGAAHAAPPAATRHVVFQVSDADPAKWNLALNNARNVQADLGRDRVEIEIVAYGPGIGMLKADSRVANRLAAALDDGVALIACQNTMRNAKLAPDDMYGGIQFVPAGVTHIMKREQEGWAYIRP